MGQFFMPRSRKLKINWNSPVFLKRYFFICSTYTSNKCFIITSNNFKKKIKPWSTIFYTPFYKTPLKWISRSESGASKSRPRWAAGTCIGNVWEYPPPPGGRYHATEWFQLQTHWLAEVYNLTIFNKKDSQGAGLCNYWPWLPIELA